MRYPGDTDWVIGRGKRKFILARVTNLNGPFTDVLKRDPCAYCGERKPIEEMSIEHIVPISEGGDRQAGWNIVGACKRCNEEKSSEPLLLFLLDW